MADRARSQRRRRVERCVVPPTPTAQVSRVNEATAADQSAECHVLAARSARVRSSVSPDNPAPRN